MTACSGGRKKVELPSNIAVEVGGKVLIKSDLHNFADAYVGIKDSAKIVAEYIEKWATEQLLYSKAEHSFKTNSEIEKLVDEYRKSLIISSFKQQIIEKNQQIPTEEQIKDYYSQHRMEMKLSEPIIKGAYLKIPKSAPKKEQNQLRQDLKKLTRESIEKIEKYSLKNIANYDFFTESWKYYSEIAKKLPLPTANKDAFVSSANFYELSDSTSVCYFIINEFKTTGAEIPLDFVKEIIISILTEQNSLKFFRDYAKKLYMDGLKNGDVIIKN